MNTKRLKKVQSILKVPLLVKKKENLFYLTGYSFNNHAEEYLLITKNNAVAFGSGLEKIEWCKKTDQLRNIGKYLTSQSLLHIEWAFTYGEGEYLKRKLTDSGLKVVVEPARSVV